jgi:hypothetical protein
MSSPSATPGRLSDVPCQVLASLYAQFGEQLLTDKVLCRGLLADSCAPFRTEVFVLSSIVREGLLSPLLTSPIEPHQQAVLAARIREELGFGGDVAAWAAKAWADAIGEPESPPPATSAGRTPPGQERGEVCQSHAARPARSGVKACTDSLLRSVLRAFQPLLDRILLLPESGPTDDYASIPLLCDGLVGVSRVSGFDSTARWIGFCQSGVHFVGLTTATNGTSTAFIRFTELQTAHAKAISHRAVTIGDLVRVELCGTTLRSRDLALLINAIREVVAVRCRPEVDIDATMTTP